MVENVKQSKAKQTKKSRMKHFFINQNALDYNKL